jgi:hypothetical protein
MDSLDLLQTVVLVVVVVTQHTAVVQDFSQQVQVVGLEIMVVMDSQTLGMVVAVEVLVPLEETFRQASELEVVELDIQAQLLEHLFVMQEVEVEPLGKETHQTFLVLVERVVEQMELQIMLPQLELPQTLVVVVELTVESLQVLEVMAVLV